MLGGFHDATNRRPCGRRSALLALKCPSTKRPRAELIHVFGGRRVHFLQQGLDIMMWLLFIGVITLLGALLAVGAVSLNQRRLRQRVARETRQLLEAPGSAEPWLAPLELPPPVARYRQLAVFDRAPVRTLNLRHAGTFCTSPSAKPAQIRGEQVFTADPPGFLWSARIRWFPGVWLDARDMALAGKGSMRVLLDATIAVVNASGPKLDQGSALRLLAEMVWYPTALFDSRYVTWSAIDERHARATLHFGEQQVSGIFEFGADGLPASVSAQRFMDQRGLRPWGGTYLDFRAVSGMLVPFEASVTWQLDSGPFTYAHWLVESMVYAD